jgi:hypothetical protein
LAHLPDKKGADFTDVVAPLIRKKAGASLNPWENLEVEDIQAIVDRAFGKGRYEVAEDGPWYGLVRENTTYVLLLTKHQGRSTSQYLAKHVCAKGS